MQKRSIVVALCGDSIWESQPYSKNKKYNANVVRDTYVHLFLAAEKEHIKFIKTSYDWYDKKTNTFEKGWIYDNDLGWLRVNERFTADIVFDKATTSRKVDEYRKIFSKKKKLFNPYYIEKICDDKYETYKLFKTLSPKTFKIKNMTQLKLHLKKIRGDMVVFKPDIGSSARGIVICKKDELLERIDKIKETMILQEYIECNRNNRIRIHFGVYDLRVVISQGKIVDSYIRASKNKKILTSNTATGGKTIFVHKDSLPNNVKRDLKIIEKKFKNYKTRLYTADFVIDKDGKVWLIELNDKPGLFTWKDSYAWKKRRNKVIDAVIKNMKDFI